MPFNSLDFAAFFLAVLGLQAILPARGRNLLLLAASWAFYAWWDWRFVGLLVGVTLWDLTISRGIVRSESRRERRALLMLSIACDVGVLIAFKYCGFFVESGARLLHALGLGAPSPILDVVMPLGVSFFTLQSLGHVIDTHRRMGEARADDPDAQRSQELLASRPLASQTALPRATGAPRDADGPWWDAFVDYACFLAFFPHLVAGPIMRSSAFLPQFQQPRSLEPSRFWSGTTLVAWGLFKKVAVGDGLGAWVDPMFDDWHHQSGATLLLAAALFGMQIYCDFSGYSDMAVGLARLLGFDVVRNFRTPFLAVSLPDFWRRWHVSLSTWFRDYVFLPLGGSRCPPARWAFNVVVVFLLSGLWHGARWHFVAWGAIHAAGYIAWNAAGALRLPSPAAPSLASRFAGGVMTFAIVTIAWIFFRAPTLGTAGSIVARIASSPGHVFWDASMASGLVGLLAVLALEGAAAPLLVDEWLERRSPGLQVAWLAAVVVGLLLLGVPAGRQFIYFQF